LRTSIFYAIVTFLKLTIICYNDDMRAKKKVTIHKKNEMVRGIDDYSLNARRALNAVYYAVQKNKLYKHNRFRMRMATMRELMQLNSTNDYVERIQEAILELKRTIVLNNYYHPINEIKYSWYATSFLNDVGFHKENDEQIIEIEVSPLILHLMQTSGNFTQLDLLKYTQKFRTKYAFKLYEYLRSFAAYRYIEITHEHMTKLLNIKEGTQQHKYYSDLFKVVERAVKNITKSSDLSELQLVKSKALSKEKIYRIIIDPEANDILKAKALREMAQKLANKKRVKDQEEQKRQPRQQLKIDDLDKHDDLIEKIARGELL
jgi:hypothetical protein